jgi:hypothetical protein
MKVYIVKITYYFPSQDGYDYIDYEYSGIEWKTRTEAENEMNKAIDAGYKNAYIVELDLAI